MFTGLKAINHFGRPDMPSFLKFVQKKHSYVSKVGVFSCGPGAMTRSVTDGVEAVNRSVLIPADRIGDNCLVSCLTDREKFLTLFIITRLSKVKSGALNNSCSAQACDISSVLLTLNASDTHGTKFTEMENFKLTAALSERACHYSRLQLCPS